jgi:UDP-N-acetylglucosamine 1-carboxyvinyltransferase
MMAASLTPGVTRIVNAALEPEVLDVMNALRAMGSRITILPPSTIEIEGVSALNPIEYTVMPDRLEAGSLLLAAAMTGGSITIANAQAQVMDVFLYKLEQMGHMVTCDISGMGITLQATDCPQAVSFTTDTYPGFPTDLQAPMMAAQCLAQGESIIYETVYENRLIHVRELQKMGAQIKVVNDRAYVTGVDMLYGTNLIASDIRASCALVLAGLVAQGTTQVSGVDHWQRGYQNLEHKLALLGARITLKTA